MGKAAMIEKYCRQKKPQEKEVKDNYLLDKKRSVFQKRKQKQNKGN